MTQQHLRRRAADAVRRLVVALALVWAALIAPSVVHADAGTPTGWGRSVATARMDIGRVELRYDPALVGEAEALAGLAPRAWTEVERAMAVDLDDTLSITLVDHAGRVADVTGMPRWVAGVAHPSSGEIIIARHGPDGAPTDLDQLLKHEMAHVALYRATAGADVPRWFHEGMAETFEGGIDLTRSKTLAAAVFGPGVPNLDELEARFHEDDGPQASAAYAAARDLVEHLRYRDADGSDLRQLMTELKHGQSFAAAFVRAYGVGLPELVREWREGLSARFIWYPLVAGGTLPFVLVFPLVLLAWVRRRKVLREGWARLEREDIQAGLHLGFEPGN